MWMLDVIWAINIKIKLLYLYFIPKTLSIYPTQTCDKPNFLQWRYSISAKDTHTCLQNKCLNENLKKFCF